jgi:GGDEF domain-containing protein
VHLGVGIGIACCSASNDLDAGQIIRRADNVLYRTKRNGKHQACFADAIDFSLDDSKFVRLVKQV